MQAVILCGGLGTRLREETEFRPKPMVNIGTKPILWHIMKIYATQGITDFILCLGYKGDMIKNYFCHYELMNNDVTLELGKPDQLCIHQNHSEAGWKITLADTGPKTLKGGRLKRIEKYIEGDTFMVTYGDGVANIDINALLEFHKSHGKMATVTGTSPSSPFGMLDIDQSQVRSFSEKPKEISNGIINGGYFVFNRGLFDYLSPEEDCDLEYGPLEDIANSGELMVYRHEGYWACMDSLRDTEQLNTIWAAGKAPWKIW